MQMHLAFIVLVTLSSSALTAKPLIEVSLNLPPTPGFCKLSDSEQADRRAITRISELVASSGNKLLGMSADCQQLADWRAGRRQLLDDYIQYQTRPVTGPSANDAMQQECSNMRREGEKIIATQVSDIKARYEAILKTIKLNEATFMGVLSEDATACYAALITQVHTEAGTDKTQLTVFAVTMPKNQIIYVYRFAPSTDSDSVATLLSRLKDTVTALYAANN